MLLFERLEIFAEMVKDATFALLFEQECLRRFDLRCEKLDDERFDFRCRDIQALGELQHMIIECIEREIEARKLLFVDLIQVFGDRKRFASPDSTVEKLFSVGD